MLTVYRASAGSGKTYQLTGEYLKLLFSGNGLYRRILAVTFTNKATDEMKSRIIQELDVLAKGEKSGYLDALCKDFSLTADEVYQKAQRILLEILHDYSSFNISTIDRFFQQTMRAFAREIGLQGGYNVELDTSRVLSEAVDNMLLTLDRPANKDLLSWLLQFSKEKIENGKSWNFKAEVIGLGEELFKEKYKRLGQDVQQKLVDKKLLADYVGRMNQICRAFEDELAAIGAKGVGIIRYAGFNAEDFAGGANSPLSHFRIWAGRTVKMPTPTFAKLADTPENWKGSAKAKHLDGVIKQAFQNGLNDLVKEALAHFDASVIYNSAIIVRKNLYSLGILADIDHHIKEIVAENNLMLLSDTTHLLNRLIDQSEAPFIYEKIGVRIDHYMIDEFQDTSVMQWQNFSPLIHNSLSEKDPALHRLSNLIVGDVKQSIYRWRSSEWRLLDERLGQEFGSRLTNEVLAENWRSGTAIVGFNNAFFSISAQFLTDKFKTEIPENLKDHQLFDELASKISRAYQDVHQRVPDSRKLVKGHVKVQWFDDKTWVDDALTHLTETMRQWLQKGYLFRDMAVLVRTKNEGLLVANELLSNHIPVISDEALLLKNSSSVKLLIALMKHLQRPDDSQLKRLSLVEAASYQSDGQNPVGNFFCKDLKDEFSGFPPETELELQQCRRMPLYEMTERLIAVFFRSPSATDSLYLQTFQDLVLEFSTKKSADLISFIDWWAETGSSKRVLMPDSQDAVRIMTIHKSKGLGFKAVAIPFGDWDLDQKPRSLIWCQPAVEPFNEIPLLPVNYTKELANSIFSFDYFEEKLHAFVDNLNLAYVAFTRAKEELVVFAPKPVNQNVNKLGALLYQCIHQSAESGKKSDEDVVLSDYLNEEADCYEDGADWKPVVLNQTTLAEEPAHVASSVSPDGRLKLKLRSRDYFVESDQMRHGTVMHTILSRIYTFQDVEASIQNLIRSGEISNEESSTIKSQIEEWITSPEVKHWFDSECRVLNETDILLPSNIHYRPDRVVFNGESVDVVDFKFGQKKLSKYHRQVSRYVELIQQMGHSRVKGFIWYVELNEVVPVGIDY